MKTSQWDHQKKEHEAHWTTTARALLWGMRCGKSKSGIDKACELFQVCEITGVIVIAPNGVHRNWTLKQLPAHHWDNVPYRAYAWRTPDKENEAKAAVLSNVPFDGLDWLTLNMEALIDDRTKKAVRAFLRTHKRFLLILDESHHFAKPGSKRTVVARGIAREAAYCLITSGTSVEESPFQMYSQSQILKEGLLGFKDYDEFKNFFATFHTETSGSRSYQAVTDYKNLDVLKERMAPFSSVVLREDCKDLPPVQPDVRLIELTDKQRELFYALKREDIDVLIEYGFQAPPEGGALLTKLHQIEGGYLNTPTGLKFIDISPKFDVVIEEAIGYSCLAWCAYRHEIEALYEKFIQQGFKAGLIYGGSPNREGILHAFEMGKLDCIAAQPAAIGEGYEILAEKILWFSQTPRAIIRAQANERASKVGAKSVQMVDIYAPGGTDEYYLDLTDNKRELADDISRYGLRAILERLNP